MTRLVSDCVSAELYAVFGRSVRAGSRAITKRVRPKEDVKAHDSQLVASFGFTEPDN